MSEIMDDKRPIELVTIGSDNGQELWRVSKGSGITAIEPYEEPGIHGSIVWLRIMRGDLPSWRLNTMYVSDIKYAEAPDAK